MAFHWRIFYLLFFIFGRLIKVSDIKFKWLMLQAQNNFIFNISFQTSHFFHSNTLAYISALEFTESFCVQIKKMKFKFSYYFFISKYLAILFEIIKPNGDIFFTVFEFIHLILHFKNANISIWISIFKPQLRYKSVLQTENLWKALEFYLFLVSKESSEMKVISIVIALLISINLIFAQDANKECMNTM